MIVCQKPKVKEVFLEAWNALKRGLYAVWPLFVFPVIAVINVKAYQGLPGTQFLQDLPEIFFLQYVFVFAMLLLWVCFTMGMLQGAHALFSLAYWRSNQFLKNFIIALIGSVLWFIVIGILHNNAVYVFLTAPLWVYMLLFSYSKEPLISTVVKIFSTYLPWFMVWYVIFVVIPMNTYRWFALEYMVYCIITTPFFVAFYEIHKKCLKGGM